MAKKVESIIDDLARLTLVAKMVQEQINLKRNILKERLSKNPKTKKHVFLGKEWSIMAIYRTSKRLDSERLRKAIGEKKYDAYKTKVVRSVEFKPVPNEIEKETQLTKDVVDTSVLALVSKVA
jgi:hypothetical protein|tara:strand:+ start:224 stop:592 length:369 start_codon:yes stop_codon:yes gene_type:complete